MIKFININIIKYCFKHKRKAKKMYILYPKNNRYLISKVDQHYFTLFYTFQ